MAAIVYIKAQETDILARTMWGESRGEGYQGMQAVANVVMNRVLHPCWWGNSVISVCKKPWQFSCWNWGDPNRQKLLAVTDADPQFREAMELAEQAINKKLPDITNGANSYFDSRISEPPQWADGKTPCATIGHHVFYKV